MCKIGNRLHSAALRLLDTARIFGAALLGCSALLTGCVNDDEPFAEPQKAVVQLSVGATAAGESTDQTTGELTEEESKLYSLRVYAFVGGRLAGHYFTKEVTMVEGKHKFYMDLTFYSTGEQKVDFYVIANEEAMALRIMRGAENSDVVTLSETTSEYIIKNVWFHNFIYTIVSTKGLPMYCEQSETLNFTNTGTQTVDVPGHEGHTLLNTKIDFALIRPMGKVNLFVAKPAGEEGELRVKKLQIVARGIPVRNYLIPQKDEEILKTIQHAADDVDILGGVAASKDPVVVTAEIGTTTDRTNPASYTLVSPTPYYAYENPYSNAGSWDVEGTDEKGFALRVEYNYDYNDNTTTHTREIYLPKIERNTYYAVCCLIHNTGEIFITYNVMDWQKGEDYNMVFEYPTYVNPIVPVVSASGTELKPNGKYPQPKIWCGPNGSATFRFTITGPTEMPWQPRLQEFGASSGDYTVEVYQLDKDGNKVMKTDPNNTTDDPNDDLEPSRDPFFITITANNPERKDRVVGLGIAYSCRWNPDYRPPLLLINGLTGDLAYDDSTYAEYILIQQVDAPTTQATE